MNLEKLFICGLTHSGKGLVRTLLDGHSQIITCPFQSFCFSLLNNSFDNFLILKKNRIINDLIRLNENKHNIIKIKNDTQIFNIRKSELIVYLFRTTSGFSDFLDSIINKKIRAGAGLKNEQFVNFEFNFNKFYENLIISLDSDRVYNREDILNIIFVNFIQCWSNNSINFLSNSKFVISSPNKIETINNILQNTTNSKIIVVKRDPVERCYVNSLQAISKNVDVNKVNFSKLKIYSKDYLFNYNFIIKMKKFYEEVENLSKINKRVLVVDFNDIFLDIKKQMKIISNFLNINYEETLEYQSLNSIKLSSLNKNFILTKNDDAYKFLTPIQINFIKYLYNGKFHYNVRIIDKISFRFVKLIKLIFKY